jgi:ABC-type amino acid transport system permease subunit
MPQLMVIFWVYFTYPALAGRTPDSSLSAIVSLSMIASAYLAEVVRAGLGSVPRSQVETAYSTGLSAGQTFAHVVLPQALRNMLPAFIAQLVMLFKTTSVVYVIGLVDFFRAIILVNNRDFAPYALYLTMAVGYFVCSFALSTVVRRLDPKYLLAS